MSDVFLLLQCEHRLEKYCLERRFFHYCCHALDDCKTEQDIKNKFVAWVHGVNVETKSIFSQV